MVPATPCGSVLAWALPEVDHRVRVEMQVPIREVTLTSTSGEQRHETGKGRRLMPVVCVGMSLPRTTWGRSHFAPLGRYIELTLRATSPAGEEAGLSVPSPTHD